MTTYRENLDRMLIEKAANSDRDYSYFHPSAFGSCPRVVWFELMGVKPMMPHGANKTRLFDNGHFIHLRHQLYCRDAGVLAKDTVVSVQTRDYSVAGTPRPMIEVVGTSGRSYPFGLDEAVWFGVQSEEEDALKVGGHDIPTLRRASALQPGDDWWLVEVPFIDEEYHFGGHCDAIVVDRGEEVVVDWKGTNDYSIPYAFYDEARNGDYDTRYPDKFNSKCFICGQGMKGGKDLCEHLMTKHADQASPDFKYVIQLHIYMWQFGLRRSILVHENKNNQLMMETEVDRDDELIDNIKERAKRLWTAAREGEIPDRPEKCSSRKNMPCKFCDFATQCWE